MITPGIIASDEKRDSQTFAIIGAAMAVHRELGHGFLEAVYQEALAMEFSAVGIPFVQQHPFSISYRGKILAATYKCDFLCFNEVIVELKALQSLSGIEQAQLINYLKCARLHKGLLLNFGGPSLEQRRVLFGAAPSPNLCESVKSVDRISLK
jgi:GxxExxY protein